MPLPLTDFTSQAIADPSWLATERAKPVMLCSVIRPPRLSGLLRRQDARSGALLGRRLASAFSSFFSLFLHEGPVAGDVAVMLFQCLGKDVPAIAVSYEIEIVCPGGIGHGFKRCLAGIGDRRRRQSIDDIGVVRRRLLDVRLIDWPVGRLALATEQAVDDRGIGLQPHSLGKAVQKHCRYT